MTCQSFEWRFATGVLGSVWTVYAAGERLPSAGGPANDRNLVGRRIWDSRASRTLRRPDSGSVAMGAYR